MEDNLQSIVEFINPPRSQMPRIINKSVHKFHSVTAKRIFYAVQSQLKKGFKDENVSITPNGDVFYNIPTYLISDSQHFSQIEKAANELMNIRFQFTEKENEKFSKITPFPVVLYEKRWGVIKVNVLSMAMPFLAELNKGYYWYQLESALSLSSKYSQRWYDLLAEKKDLGKLQITIEEIRILMDLSDEFNNVSNLLRKVIYNPIKEINEKTEMYIEHTPINNQKRPIIGFNFTISSQNTQEMKIIQSRKSKYFEEFNNLSAKDKSIRITLLMKEYSLENQSALFDEYNLFDGDILNSILESDANIKSGKIKIQKTKEKYMAGVIKQAIKTVKNRRLIAQPDNIRVPSEEMKKFLEK